MISLVWYSCSEKMEIPSESKVSKPEDPELPPLKSGIVVEKRGSDYILDGDMILFPEQLKALDEKGTLTTDESGSVSAETRIHPVLNVPMSALNPEKSTLPPKSASRRTHTK